MSVGLSAWEAIATTPAERSAGDKRPRAPWRLLACFLHSALAPHLLLFFICRSARSLLGFLGLV
ncbi:hypothetical protein ABZP36_003814 [Zizania latifolia]